MIAPEFTSALGDSNRKWGVCTISFCSFSSSLDVVSETRYSNVQLITYIYEI
jgi:hypothetical protein